MFDGPTTLGLKLDNQTVFLESVTGSEWQCSSKVSLPPNGTSGLGQMPSHRVARRLLRRFRE
jgi:hypothetical protein